jgi:hypothetical protein
MIINYFNKNNIIAGILCAVCYNVLEYYLVPKIIFQIIPGRKKIKIPTHNEETLKA